ncbi:MAG TPA: hypothetical protein VKQ73_13955 [Stellaceae bacterium]|nr:hypothetical protein [Stellaceae bacterium]
MPLGRRLSRATAVARPLSPTASHADAHAVAAAPAPPPPASISPRRTLVALTGPVMLPVGHLALSHLRPSLRLLSFIIVVAIPAAVAAAYYFAIAADQYVAEFRFTLNTADPPRLDPLSLIAGTATQSPATQEAQILVQYITSRAIVDEIDRSLDLRTLFAPPTADWWARPPRSASIEELVRYWKRQVDPFYDSANGTVTVRVRAFAPQDALRLAQAIVAAGEKLANDLSLRARRDALGRAESDLTQAEARLKSVLGKIREFRDRAGMIDPAQTAQATGTLATRLRGELIKANAELATLRTYMHDSAPTVKVLRARIGALEAQERSLAREMTGAAPTRSDTLSHVLGSYEELESDQKFAEAAYQHALQGLDQARANADRQQVFIASFVPPSLPEDPLYPRRWRALGIVALVASAVWGIGGLAMRSISDHLA